MVMHQRGMTIGDIAETLGISTKAVQIYLPYTKGTYLTENKSKNAQNIRNFRMRHSSDKV